jgi:hypothetical protein
MFTISVIKSHDSKKCSIFNGLGETHDGRSLDIALVFEKKYATIRGVAPKTFIEGGAVRAPPIPTRRRPRLPAQMGKQRSPVNRGRPTTGVDFFAWFGSTGPDQNWRWAGGSVTGPTATSFPSRDGETRSVACGRGFVLRDEADGREGVSGAQFEEGPTRWGSTRATKTRDARWRSDSDRNGCSRRQRVICRAGIRPARVGCTCKPPDSWECRQTVPVRRGRGSQNSRTGPAPDIEICT